MKPPRRLNILLGAVVLCGTFNVVAQSTAASKRASQAAMTPKKPEPAVYELRCRGVGSGFDFRPVGESGPVPVAMSFSKSPHAAGTEAAGLLPGTCSWIDRPVNDAEPAVLYFEPNEQAPDAQTIASHLRDPDHYWSFFVFNTNNGYFQATRHEIWKSPEVQGQTGRTLPRFEPVPRNSIRLVIQYKKEYGYGNTASAFGGSQRSCSAFAIFVRPVSAEPPPVLIGIPSTGVLSETADHYVCEYLFTDVPLDYPVTLELSVREPTQPWTGGTEATPPPGEQRIIVDPTRTVTLTKNQSRVRLLFDMVYAPHP